MRRALVLLIVALLGTTTAWAQQTYYYETVNKHSQKLTDHSRIRMEKTGDGEISVHFEEGQSDYPQQEDYIFNAAYESISFHVVNTQSQTDFNVRREGNSIIIKGKLNGQSASRTLAIDNAPLFGFPKFNLARFVLSDEKKITFWAMRHDDLNAYKMIVTREGREKITVNGQSIEAIKVTFTTENPLFHIFKRTYYFRPTDGLFLKQEYADGRVRELVKEE